MNLTRLKKVFLISFLCAGTSVAIGQVAPPPPITPPCGDPNNPFSPPCPIPIDGGATLLIAAGLAFGGKKALDLRKRHES